MPLYGGSWWCLAALICLPTVVGCGGGDMPDLGDVSGQVTLDGQPLEGVIILFKPEIGRVATATTDAEGKYELEYLYEVPGCKVGPNKVSFEWPLGATNAKKLSARYTTNSELTADVKPGANTFDFALESDAGTKAEPIVIPD